MSLRRNVSGAASTRELFKPSKDSASLQVCSEKKFFGYGFFVSDVIGGVVLGLFGPLHLSLIPDH